MTNTAPQTYAAAAANAKQITVDELAALIAEHDDFDIFPAPRRRRQIAMSARLRLATLEDGSERGWIAYDCFTAKGHLTTDTASVGTLYNRPVFYFSNLGHMVQVAAPC